MAKQTTGIKIFRNRAIATKLNIALGAASLLTMMGIILAGIIAEQQVWKEIQTQAKSEVTLLGQDFKSTSAPTNSQNLTPPDRQQLQNLVRRSKPALVVDKDAVITEKVISELNKAGKLAKTSIGSKFDPSGLVSKAIATGSQITSTELGSENGLVIYTVTPIKEPPIKDRNQSILGATIVIIPVDTADTLVGIDNKAFTGFRAIATANDLKSDKFSPNFPVNILKKGLTETVAEEVKIEGVPYIVAASPILNYKGEAIGTFINANRYQPSLIALQVIGLGTIFVIVGYVLAFGIIRAIIKSIQDLERSAQDYANGNLLAQIKVSAKDEIGTLANLFNTMIEKIHKSETDRAGVRAQVQAQSLELEDEVGLLLDVVSDLESGNLTVQAQVTDRATGLVADTLNRLIEQLATIMSTVLSTAQQVTQGADSLEQLATSVTQNAQLQSQSVAQATDGIENINRLATNASEEAIAANIAVESAQTAVSLGQTEITKLNNSIALLQQGTTQIVQRLKTLGEFVDLAKQFVQDQKRLSSLTQVVAMNASMIAARAVEQKEPDQFASVAREFEAIASQVNNLATQTSQGLVVLQQRTGFIEIVVSGISQDIQDVTNYVTEFTTGVEQSSQAFNDIKDVTGQVAALGQTVFNSSQEIAEAVQTSVDSIQEIAALAQRSASQSTLTLERSAQMGQLARRLLSDVRFFQLPADKIPQNFLVPAINGGLANKSNN